VTSAKKKYKCKLRPFKIFSFIGLVEDEMQIEEIDQKKEEYYTERKN
jgi:hypothetical protein